MSKRNEEKLHGAVRGTITFILCLALLAAVWFCFEVLLRPKDSPSSDTLVAISNSYKEDIAQKGDIYDRSGTLLMTNTVLGQNGRPALTDDGYQKLSDLDEEAQEQADFTRLIWDTEQVQCWSNLLPAISGGLDSDLSGILQDIPLNSEEKSDVVLTIDGSVQADAFQSLSDRRFCSAVVMDCHTGDVLAMVSKPSYDYNAFRFDSIPFTVYFRNSNEFYNNVDNSYDCVQDYYNRWSNAFLEDNTAGTNVRSWKMGENVRAWEKEKEEKGLLFTEEQAQEILSSWNADYGTQLALADCIDVDFEEIFQQEYAFEQKEEKKYREAEEKETYYEKERFPFTFEPEQLGNGTDYVPFVRYTNADQEVRYLILRYGSNNFIYEDCKAHGFDPNFSFRNQVLDQSQPGSCFKILLSAQLLDQADESLLVTDAARGITTLNISNEYPGEPQNFPGMPSAETSRIRHSSLIHAMSKSSNDFFAMAAMLLDPILRTQETAFECTYDGIIGTDTAVLQRSGARMQEYYEAKFCINQKMDSYFRIPQSKILGCLNQIQVDPGKFTGEDDSLYFYDDTLRYDVDENGDPEQAYTDSKISLIKKIGDTAYGQGYDMITPLFMAQSIGKCLTGTMYLPNILQDVTIAAEPVGEPFDRGDATVELMQDHLRTVYNEHTGNVPDTLSYDYDAFSYYSKTGTSSMDAGFSTQSSYGLFAQAAGYPLHDGAYQMIWYTGAVSDGTNCYAIVLRSYFDSDSYSLKKEFLTIVDSLYRNGYLNE